MLTYRDSNGALCAWNHVTGEASPVSLPTAKVFQDGRDFYVGDDAKTDHLVTAPMRVADMDTVAASNARDWFVKVHAPRAGFTPVFVGATFEPEA